MGRAGTVSLRYSSELIPVSTEPRDADLEALPLKMRRAILEMCDFEPSFYHLPDFVYFIEAVGLRRMKIGFSRTGFEKRIDSIATSCPAPIHVHRVVYGSIEIERNLHHIFRVEHVHREWFALSPRLKSFVEALAGLDVRPLEKLRRNLMIYPTRPGDQHCEDACRSFEDAHRQALTVANH